MIYKESPSDKRKGTLLPQKYYVICSIAYWQDNNDLVPKKVEVESCRDLKHANKRELCQAH